jgi:hypothetical protein
MAREGVPSTSCLRHASKDVDARPAPSMTRRMSMTQTNTNPLKD